MVRRFELRVDVGDAVPFATAELAVTLVVPDGDVAGARVLAFGFPGGGYARAYWDITWPGLAGYSEAEHHADRGWLFAAVDHLGVGESSMPDPSALTMEVVAAANDAAARAIAAGLRRGTLVEGLAPVDVACSIALGQSMGGCLTIVAQGRHRTFDAIGVLGFSALHTVLPSPAGGVAVTPVDRGRTEEELLAASTAEIGALDVFAWAFHMDDVEPALLDADMGSGYPVREGTPPAWGSLTVPPCAVSMLSPGVVAAEAGAVDVPVFVGVGERDVCPDPWAEPSGYRASRDISLLVVPGMAHMHNFARTREQLWRRVHAWGDTVGGAAP